MKIAVEKLVAEKASDRQVIDMLEEKIEKAETEVFTHFKELKNTKESLLKANENISVLKNVISNTNKEVSKNKDDLAQFAKVMKGKNKDLHNFENKVLNQPDIIKNLKDQIKGFKAEKSELEKEVTRIKRKMDKGSRKDKNQNSSSIEKGTGTDAIFKCEVCEQTFKNKATINAHIRIHHNETLRSSCNHVMQCIARKPKSPPCRKWQNGDGMTVCLPNQAEKIDIEKYESEFGDHECEDCNMESILCETACIYQVKSCGNNLVQFEATLI